MSEVKPHPTQCPPTASMGFPAPVHGAPYQAGPPPQYAQAGHPVQYAQPMVIQQGYQPAPDIVHVVTQPPTPPRVYDIYRAKQSVVLGAIQITVGIFSIILNIIGIIVQIGINSYVEVGFYREQNISFYFGYGILGAIFYILAGSFAVAAAKKKTKCPVIANMVLSILSAVCVWIHIYVAAVSVYVDASHPRTVYNSDSYDIFDPYDYDPYNPYDYDWDNHSHQYRYTDAQWSTIQASLALSCIMLIIGLVEFVVAVWSSTLACRVTCCGNSNRPQQYVTPGPHVTYGQYPGPPLGAGVAYTGASAQPIGPGVVY